MDVYVPFTGNPHTSYSAGRVIYRTIGKEIACTATPNSVIIHADDSGVPESAYNLIVLALYSTPVIEPGDKFPTTSAMSSYQSSLDKYMEAI